MSQTRRLAAILAADMAGYSRLMGADEEGTLAALKAIRRELGDPKVKEHRGRIVKTTGDGLLIEFVSVVDAVLCAVQVQDDPSFPVPYRRLAACYAHMGRLDDVREVVTRLRGITSEVMPDVTYLRNTAHRELFLSGLRLAAGEQT
jgi:class 3 adenylate cyclase